MGRRETPNRADAAATVAVHTLHAAATELSGAVAWYEAQQPGLGAEFYAAVSRVVDYVRSHPTIGTRLAIDEHTRRVLVTRFPYQLVYRTHGNDVVIVAVAHLRRRPGYWQSRAAPRPLSPTRTCHIVASDTT